MCIRNVLCTGFLFGLPEVALFFPSVFTGSSKSGFINCVDTISSSDASLPLRSATATHIYAFEL